jgi:hypothetical protein
MNMSEKESLWDKEALELNRRITDAEEEAKDLCREKLIPPELKRNRLDNTKDYMISDILSGIFNLFASCSTAEEAEALLKGLKDEFSRMEDWLRDFSKKDESSRRGELKRSILDWLDKMRKKG